MKESIKVDEERTYWHPAFCGITEWELKLNRDDLFFDSEFQLSKKPIQMDMLVIKKNSSATIENEIGKLFKKHNIFEFKGSGDSLSIDDYYKTIAYGCHYKSLGKHVDEIPAEEITLTMIREAHPRELFKILEESGVTITEKYKGIYYLTGKVLFDTQIIVTKEVDGKKHPGLKILSRNAKEDDVRTFLQDAKEAKEPADYRNIDAVLQVSVSENEELFRRIREDDRMCQALKELMKEEIAEERADERIGVRLSDIKELMRNMKLSADQAMNALGIPDDEQSKYSAML